MFLLVVLISAGVFGAYYLRWRIMRGLLATCSFCMRMYNYSFEQGVNNDALSRVYSSSDALLAELGVHIVTYRLVKDRKHYVVHHLEDSPAVYGDDQRLLQLFVEKFENRNMIVHCSLTDADDNVLLDMTKLLREFYLYFEGPYHLPLSVFLTYAVRDIDDIDNCYVTVYLNDEYFSEKKVLVSEAWTNPIAWLTSSLPTS